MDNQGLSNAKRVNTFAQIRDALQTEETRQTIQINGH